MHGISGRRASGDPTWQSVGLRAPRLWRTEAATRTPALGSIQSVSPYTKLTGTCIIDTSSVDFRVTVASHKVHRRHHH